MTLLSLQVIKFQFWGDISLNYQKWLQTFITQHKNCCRDLIKSGITARILQLLNTFTKDFDMIKLRQVFFAFMCKSNSDILTSCFTRSGLSKRPLPFGFFTLRIKVYNNRFANI